MTDKLIKQLRNSSPMIAALMGANILNFAFNAFLARSLPLGDYGFIALLNTFWTILLVGSGAVTQITSYQVARSARDSASSLSAYLMTQRITRKLAFVLAATWLAISPALVQFFHAPSFLPILVFAPMIWLGLLAGTHRGYVQGRLRFNQFGALFLIEAGSKFVIVVGLVEFGFDKLAYISLPLSVGIAWLAAVIAARRLLPRAVSSVASHSAFPWSFLGANVVTGLAAMAFLSVDLLLAKHYLSGPEAGRYAMLSLIGKMIYFVGSLLNSFILPMIGTAESNGTNARKVFWRVYSLTSAMALIGFLVLGPLGHLFVPILFGPNSKAILPDLVLYSAGITLFTLANISVIYHLAKKHYIFPALSLATAVFMSVRIIVSHDTIAAIANAVFLSGLAGFIVITSTDLLLARGRATSKSLRKVVALLAKRQTVVPASDAVRILIFNWRDTRHAQAGGAEIYIHELAKRWRMTGHEVTLFCGNDGESPRNETIDGIHIVRRGSFYVAYFWAFYHYVTQFRGHFDVIVDCHNGIPFFTPLYAREPVLCVVHHVHQDVFTQYLPKPLAMLARFLEAKAMPWVYRRSNFMTVSKSSKQAMANELGIEATRIQIIHNGVNLTQFEPGLKATTPTVLYVGRLKAYKSVDVLLRSFAKVSASRPTAILNVAGTGDAMNDLIKLAAELDISGKVIFLGFVSEERKIQLMQDAWVLVNPSYAEGWGITTIEANACGTPVIASDVPGLRDSVNAPSAGYLVRYGDVNGFARKILLVLNNSEKRQDLSTNAKTWAKRFDWQTSATTFLERIEKLS